MNENSILRKLFFTNACAFFVVSGPKNLQLKKNIRKTLRGTQSQKYISKLSSKK